MNFLLDPNLWYDDWDGSNPPITWNEEEKRYEFVHSSSPPHQTHTVGIYSDVFPEAGTLDFEYLVSDYSAYSHSDELRIQILSFDLSALEESTILDQVVVLGQPTRVTIETAPNHDYRIIFTYISSGYYYGNFYYVDALITPIISEVSVSIPWWACVRPDPPEPCPVRANPAEEFVPFDDYDADFKFPLASSRKPMKIVRPQGCVACGPNLTDAVDPEPDPEPGVLTLCGMYSEGPADIFHNPAFDPEKPLYVEQNGVSAEYWFDSSANTWRYGSGDNILGWSTPQEILVIQGDREWNAIWHRGAKLECAPWSNSWVYFNLPEGTFPFTLVTEEGSYPAEFDNYQLIWPEGPPLAPAIGEYYMATIDYGFGNTYCCQVNAVTGWG